MSKILLRLYRQYSKTEVVKYLYNELNRVNVKNGELLSEVSELQDALKSVQSELAEVRKYAQSAKAEIEQYKTGVKVDERVQEQKRIIKKAWEDRKKYQKEAVMWRDKFISSQKRNNNGHQSTTHFLSDVKRGL